MGWMVPYVDLGIVIAPFNGTGNATDVTDVHLHLANITWVGVALHITLAARPAPGGVPGNARLRNWVDVGTLRASAIILPPEVIVDSVVVGGIVTILVAKRLILSECSCSKCNEQRDCLHFERKENRLWCYDTFRVLWKLWWIFPTTARGACQLYSGNRSNNRARPVINIACLYTEYIPFCIWKRSSDERGEGIKLAKVTLSFDIRAFETIRERDTDAADVRRWILFNLFQKREEDEHRMVRGVELSR